MLEENKKLIASQELWRRGILYWKLRPEQKELYDLINGTEAIKFVLKVARRFGKTFTLILDSIETALKYPGIYIPYIAPEQKMIRRIIHPIVTYIKLDCPSDCWFDWNIQDGAYVFKNGSKIFVAGTDKKQYENLRGIDVKVKAYVDEAGFCHDLKYILSDILIPATLTGGGRIVLASTPARTPGHDFYYICHQAESRNNLVKRTIDDNKHITDRVKKKYIEEAGGIESTTCRREYYCEDVTDESIAIFPEFSKYENDIVMDYPCPPYYFIYSALDPGFKDYTGYIIGYHDFIEDKIVIEDELWLKGVNTNILADEINKVEKRNFSRKIYMRVSDTSWQVITDLTELHGLRFTTTRKDDRDAAINNIRILFQNGKIKINPRCKNLIRQCRIGIWNTLKKDFERIAGEGHFDLIAALMYFVRNIDRHKNPYPAWDGKRHMSTHWVNNIRQYTDSPFNSLIPN